MSTEENVNVNRISWSRRLHGPKATPASLVVDDSQLVVDVRGYRFGQVNQTRARIEQHLIGNEDAVILCLPEPVSIERPAMAVMNSEYRCPLISRMGNVWRSP